MMTAYRKFIDTQHMALRAAKPSKASNMFAATGRYVPTFGGLGGLAKEQAAVDNCYPPKGAIAPALLSQEGVRRTPGGEKRAVGDGEAPRAWAEGLACLDPNRPPRDVPPKQWIQFISDFGQFLNRGWAERALLLAGDRSIFLAATASVPSRA